MSDYNTTIGVQIYDDFAKLQSELPKLISNLERIKTSLGDISNIKISSQGLSNISKQLSKIVNLDSLSNDLNKLNSTLDKLNVGNLKAMREEISRLKQEYSNYINTMNRATGNKIKTSNTANTVKNSNYLSEGLNDIKGTRNQNITSYIRQMNNGLSDVDKNARNVKLSVSGIFSLVNIHRFVNYARSAFGILGGFIEKAMDFTETENYFSRAMGNMYDKAMLFQNKLTDMYGMSMNTMMNAQATYKNMIGSLGGLSDEMSYKLSETVTKMTLDFSSLYNVDFDKTVAKMQSALSKQVRPIRSVSGYDITQNVLGATAQDLGISRSISEMNELEKRLLIVLTLANQMRNSGAMNDFARTIEQPSNQLRILQEQLIEVGRWIGSVFYGVIGSVLPYINGFVMAIKELIKTFALFVGYTVPDSSGETQTILDSLDASTDDINTGLDDVGKNTDKNIKKAKEWKNVLMSFDVADVIPDQSSSDSSGNSSSSSGTGGLTVDPKILDALKNYNYIFDDIHMKAQDIRDELLKWAAIAKKAISNEIFKPMQNSWNKYGKSTIKNFCDGWENIKVIGADVFDVISIKWRPFFQQASNLFFSLMDTGSLVFSTITGIAKDVWNTGGRVFLEGVFDLTTAVLRLAVAINDDFIKPTVKLFKNTLGVVLSKTLGMILNLIGQFMSYLAQLITAFSKNSIAVRILATSFTAMYATIKLGQLMKLFNSMDEGLSVTQKLSKAFLEHTSVGKKLSDIYDKTGSVFSTLKMAWNGGLSVISGLFTKMSNAVQATNLYKNATSNLVLVEQNMTTAQTLAAKATVLLQNALNFLASHPLVAVAIAIGTAVVALGAFASSQKSTGKAIEDCSQEIQDEYNEIKDLSSAIDSAKKSADDQIATTKAQIKMANGYIDKLKEMEGKDGYVKNISQARTLVNEINGILPDTVKLSKDGRVEWQKTPEEISKTTEAMKKQAEQQAYQQVYVETIKNQILQEQKLAEQQEKRTELINKEKEAYNLYLESLKYSREQKAMTFEEYIRDNEAIKEQDALIRETQKEIDKTSKTTKDYEKKLDKLNGTLDENADSTKKSNKETKKLSQATQSAYDNIGKTGKKEINKIISELKDYDKKMNDTSKNGKKLSDDELNSLKKARSEKIKQYGQLVRDYNFTYDQIIEIAENQGVKLTNEEKGTIGAIVKTYKDGGQKAGNKFVEDLNTNLNNGKTKTSKTFINLATSASNTLKNNPVNFATSVTSILEKTKKRLTETNGITSKGLLFNSDVKSVSNKAKNRSTEATKAVANSPVKFNSVVVDLAKNATATIKSATSKIPKISIGTKVTGDMYSAGVNAGKSFKKGFVNNAETTIKYTIDGTVKTVMTLKPYATGGFPDVGQMFIARENGIPELVGTMGGKNAVANNTQIENGIYRAVLQAMRDSGNSRMVGGDLHITIQNADGTKIEKVIKDYNKLMQMTGGKGGFVI